MPLLLHGFEGMADHRVKGPEGLISSASVFGFIVGGVLLLLYMGLVPCSLVAAPFLSFFEFMDRISGLVKAMGNKSCTPMPFLPTLQIQPLNSLLNLMRLQRRWIYKRRIPHPQRP